MLIHFDDRESNQPKKHIKPNQGFVNGVIFYILYLNVIDVFSLSEEARQRVW